MTSKVKETIKTILLLEFLVFLLLVNASMLVHVFMAGEPMGLTRAIILTTSFVVSFSLISDVIRKSIRKINELIRLGKKELEEQEEE